MLSHAEVLFEDMYLMMGRLKKAAYERNMEIFRERHGSYLAEMISEIENSEDAGAAAERLAEDFTEQVKKAFSVREKIKAPMQADLNSFMIYYVFPAILLTESEYAVLLADHIRDAWREKFKNSNIQYTEYQTIYNGFRDKIFGMF